MGVNGIFNSTASWFAWNLTSEAVIRRQDPSRVMSLRYEDFAADPIGTTVRILQLIDEPGRQLPFVDETTVALTGNHTVSGNPARYVQGLVPIREDDEWRSHMSSSQRFAITVMTLPGLMKYGYRFDGAIHGVRDRPLSA